MPYFPESDVPSDVWSTGDIFRPCSTLGYMAVTSSRMLSTSQLRKLPAPVVLFGGTFDPVQRAHCTIARRVLSDNRYSSGCVLFIPARRNPLKAIGPQASDQARLEMLELALNEELFGTRCFISPIELEGPPDAPSYTVETVREIQRNISKQTELHLLMGSDSAVQFDQWREYQGLLELVAELIIFPRAAGDQERMSALHGKLPVDLQHKFVMTDIPGQQIPVSSTEIRKSLRSRDGVSGLLAPAVERYILEHELYKE